ncbi:MAG TPA: NAD-dependent epimerase/dehydratase family protein, partial [Candidatus Synoicihabitans sp.]|nr:NAD-dependent epimerase/dehydratase family protein [Candidatus Synoicihabitans sp.]
VDETYSTLAPVSLYGATKLASEALALEYGATFKLPVFVNRCGVLAGAGQFGRADQGIFSYWLHSHRQRAPLRYIGFDGGGHQVRDCLHPRDLVDLLQRQFSAPSLAPEQRVVNVSGGAVSAMSLRQLTAWCDERFGAHPVASDATPRPFDLPWVVLDHAKATALWSWRPSTSTAAILDEIAAHAEQNPDWLAVSAPF